MNGNKSFTMLVVACLSSVEEKNRVIMTSALSASLSSAFKNCKVTSQVLLSACSAVVNYMTHLFLTVF